MQFASALPWLIAAVVAAAVLATTLLARRREMAVYRLSGSNRRATAGVLCVESLAPTIWAIPLGVAWGLVAAFALAGGPLDARSVAVSLGYAGAAWLAYAGFAVGISYLAPVSNPFRVLKDS
ncbi:FtsX-like permease family protein [Demequina sp.]|uniref:FtsX-like permease family protein n=1 Tax=Demequina sp. TaxID=2050685 RepID=UPI003D0DB63B